MIKKILSITLLLSLLLNTMVYANTSEIYIANSPVIKTANAIETLGETDKEALIPATSVKLSLTNETYNITKVRAYYSSTNYKEYTSYTNMDVWVGQKVVLYHNSSQRWLYSIDNTAHIIGIDKACRFTVPSGASGTASLYTKSYYREKIQHDYFLLEDSSGWVWYNRNVTFTLGE